MDGQFYDKIVVVTQKTALEELIERFNTADQARFYIEHMGGDFGEYRAAHDTYHGALHSLMLYLPKGIRHQVVERGFLPNFLFGPRDIVAVLGRDGLVVNAAKYLDGQPLVGFNPDPARIDGVLVPFPVERAPLIFPKVVNSNCEFKALTMACAKLNDGQALYAVNDLFIGQKSHTSARYRLQLGEESEDQSSSGIIVSTGAGSTGWFRSVLAGAAGVMAARTGNAKLAKVREQYRFDAEADYLYFSVREPFAGNTTGAELVFGKISAGEELVITSQMPRNGAIFSDGIEADFLEFNSGSVARIGVADKRVNLVVG